MEAPSLVAMVASLIVAWTRLTADSASRRVLAAAS